MNPPALSTLLPSARQCAPNALAASLPFLRLPPATRCALLAILAMAAVPVPAKAATSWQVARQAEAGAAGHSAGMGAGAQVPSTRPAPHAEAPVLLAQATPAGDGKAGAGSKALDNELIIPPDSMASPGRLDYPRRKPGLWEIRNSSSEQLGLPPVRLCVGDQTDTPEHHLDRKVGKRGACQLGAFKRVGINWVADSTCKDSRSTIVSQSTVTGDFQSRYRIDTVILYSPPLANNRREDHEYTEARWLSACPSNQKPADLTIPGMGVLNMLDGGLRPESGSQH